MSLKQKTVKGLFWTFSHQAGTKVINFIVQIILARILIPSDFGLIAMIMVFVSIGNSLTDSGLTSSLIRTTNTDNRDYSTVFFINLTGSFFIYIVVYFAAPIISRFYEQAVLTSIVRVFGLSYIIRALVGVQTAILTKSLNFKKLTLMQLPSVVIGGVVGVYLAINGYGVWSLVWLNLTQALFFTVQLWFSSSWYPSLIFDKDRFKVHFNFGYKLGIAGVMNAIFANIYNLIIGKWFSSNQLGYYNRADSIRMFPLTTIITAFKSVAYPILSTLNDNDDRLKIGYSRMMVQVVFWITPMMLVLVLIAEPLFRFLLTDKWLPAVPFFQILCFSSILLPLEEYNLQILDVKGRSDLYLKLELFKKAVTVIAIFSILPFGLHALLYLQIALAMCFFYVSSRYCGKLINFTFKEQVRDIYPTFIIAFSIAIIFKLFDMVVLYEAPDLYRIIGISTLYFLCYGVVCFFFKSKALVEVSGIFNSMTKRIFK